MNPRLKTISEIESILQSRFGLTADIQVIHPKGENRTLYLLENVPLNRRMTVAGVGTPLPTHRQGAGRGAVRDGQRRLWFLGGMLHIFDMKGIAVSAGAACNSKVTKGWSHPASRAGRNVVSCRV